MKGFARLETSGFTYVKRNPGKLHLFTMPLRQWLSGAIGK
jgi:hypothetical protein